MQFQSSYDIAFENGEIRYGGMPLPIPNARRMLASLRIGHDRNEPYAKRLAVQLEQAFRDAGVSETEEPEQAAA